MSLKKRLKVVVTPELTIDAGWWEEVEDNQNSGVYRIVHPPAVPMYTQVVEYLAGLKLWRFSSSVNRLLNTRINLKP
jgi:hypothetical protein